MPLLLSRSRGSFPSDLYIVLVNLLLQSRGTVLKQYQTILNNGSTHVGFHRISAGILSSLEAFRSFRLHELYIFQIQPL